MSKQVNHLGVPPMDLTITDAGNGKLDQEELEWKVRAALRQQDWPTVLNAIDARERGAMLFTRTRCTRAERGEQAWQATLQGADGRTTRVQARALVNAAGPWAEAFLRGTAKPAHGEPLATKSLRLVKGSHIVVPARGLCPVDEQRLAKAGLTLAQVSIVADALTTPYQAVRRAGVTPGGHM